MTEWRGRRVLVTGGFGFIGSNVAAACASAGADVTIYDSMDPNCGGNRANVSEFAAQVAVIEADVRDGDALAAALTGQDVVIHCAAYTSHGRSMVDPFTYHDVNCRGTLTLLDAARKARPHVRIVHIGTSTQIGRMQCALVEEMHPEFPLDVYSATKVGAEKLVHVYARSHGLDATVVRLANVYGPRAHIRTSAFGFVNFFVGLALRGQPMTVYGDGGQLRHLTYVDDAVDAVLRVASATDLAGEVLFASAPEQRTVGDIAWQIARCIGGSVKHVPWPPGTKTIDIGDARISSARIADRTGWNATTTLEAGLAQTRDYYAPRLVAYL